MTNKRLQNSYSSSVQVKYLSKIHTSWISNHCAISLSVPSVFNKLRVPNTEVFIWFFPLWKNSDSWPHIPSICRVLQMYLQSLKHLSRGSHVTSIKNLMRKKKKKTVVWKTKLEQGTPSPSQRPKAKRTASYADHYFRVKERGRHFLYLFSEDYCARKGEEDP